MREGTKRQSNYELLRIVAIVLIIAHHFSYHSDMTFDPSVISINRLWSQLLFYGGHVGLDVFVLISGYFLVDSDRINLSKIVRIWLTMFTYSVGAYIFISACGIKVEFFDEIKSWAFTPLSKGIWPFASAYCELMLIYPFINKLVRVLNKNSYRVLVAIMILFWSVIPTFTSFDFGCNYLLWMCALYILAGYIKKYPEDFMRGKTFYRRIMLAVWGLSYATAIVFDLLGMKYEVLAKYATHFSGMQHINIVLIAVCLFIGFRDIEIKKESSCKIINAVAGTTFGIFLIHDNTFLKLWIWKQLFRNAEYINEWWFIPASLGEIVVIFVGCMIIEFIRQKILEKWYMKGINRLFERPQKFLDSIMIQK